MPQVDLRPPKVLVVQEYLDRRLNTLTAGECVMLFGLGYYEATLLSNALVADPMGHMPFGKIPMSACYRLVHEMRRIASHK